MSSPSHAAAAAHFRGVIFVVVGALWWSIGGMLSRLISTDPLTTAFWRALTAALFIFAYLALTRRGAVWRDFREAGRAGLLAAACWATASTAFVVALQFTTVATISVIQSLGPFAAALLAYALMGERLRQRTWIAIAVATMGIVVMMARAPQGGDLIGTLIAFLMSIVFASTVVIMRYHREVRMTSAACLGAVLAALATAPFAAIDATPMADMPYLIAFGVLQLGAGLIFFTIGAPRVPAAQATLLATIEPIMAPLWVWIGFREYPGALVLAGGALVLTALVGHALLDLREGRRFRDPR